MATENLVIESDRAISDDGNSYSIYSKSNLIRAVYESSYDEHYVKLEWLAGITSGVASSTIRVGSREDAVIVCRAMTSDETHDFTQSSDSPEGSDDSDSETEGGGSEETDNTEPDTSSESSNEEDSSGEEDHRPVI